jgi:hypothetical protein
MIPVGRLARGRGRHLRCPRFSPVLPPAVLMDQSQTASSGSPLVSATPLS